MATGYISNALSKASCQKQVASWVFKEFIGERPFTLLDQEGSMHIRSAFDSAGATYSVLAAYSDGPETWPRVTMETSTLIPFFTSVDYFWEREGEIGEGATRWFFCLFGKSVEIGETNHIVS